MRHNSIFYFPFSIFSRRRGMSLIEVVMSIGLITMLFGGVLLAYFAIITVVGNAALRNQAITIVNREAEIVRNLPYDSVGTVGGIPSGVLTAQKIVTSTANSFTVNTTVRNIDDPYDGTLGGSPNDTAPADYKLIEIEVSCPACQTFVPIAFTTTVAPKDLESASTNGSLFINILDSWAQGIPDVTIHVTNASVTPAIDLTDTTNASGILQLVGVPTSTSNYRMTATKTGYPSDQSYRPGSLGASIPELPDATVSVQEVTSVTFSNFDKESMLTVLTRDLACTVRASQDFSIQGSKVIGTSPDVLKFSTSTATNASGTKIFQNLDFDTYALTYTDGDYNVFGTSMFPTFSLGPDASATFMITLVSPQDNALLVTLKDAVSGVGVASGTVVLTRSGFASEKKTGQSFFSQTDWSGSGYSLQDGGVDAEDIPGALTLFLNASGTYDVGVTHWLISNTIDGGSTSTNWYSIDWDPISQPVETGSLSLTFQIAANNDNSTWNFTGPDGTVNTYYNATGSLSAAYNGNRYLRYKVFFTTADENYTPELDSVTAFYGNQCIPLHQAYFDGLSANTYTVTANAPGYTTATSSVVLDTAWEEAVMMMNP